MHLVCVGVMKAVEDYEALAQDPDVDIVYVSNIHPAHKDASILMMDHGKHVLCEKPLAVSPHSNCMCMCMCMCIVHAALHCCSAQGSLPALCITCAMQLHAVKNMECMLYKYLDCCQSCCTMPLHLCQKSPVAACWL